MWAVNRPDLKIVFLVFFVIFFYVCAKASFLLVEIFLSIFYGRKSVRTVEKFRIRPDFNPKNTFQGSTEETIQSGSTSKYIGPISYMNDIK